MMTNVLDDYEKYLSAGQNQWVVEQRKLDFGPFKGEAMPTVFFMDVEYDPVFAQFCPDGLAWVFNSQGAKWTTLSPQDLRRLADLAEEHD